MTTLRQLLTRTEVSQILRSGRSNPGSWGQFRAFVAQDEASRPEASELDSVVAADYPESVEDDVEPDDSDTGILTSAAAAPEDPDLKQSGASEGHTDVSPFRRRDEEFVASLYKATLLGRVVQAPVQKVLKSGRAITQFQVGTGGMRNNRRPFEGETVEEFTERKTVQWHKVSVYDENLGAAAMRWMKAGSQVFVEGNLETRVYNDPSSGLVKRIKEVSVRRTGKLLFMDQIDQKGSVPRASKYSLAADAEADE